MSIRSTQLTYEGLTALARANSGESLHFTRVLMGSGRISDEQNLRQLTGLVNPELELPIKKVKVTGVGTSILETQLKNAGVEKGFMATEVGIFASVNNEDEILYAYRNTGDDSEYIPAGGGSEVWNLTYGYTTVIDQAENVTATINGDIAYVTYIEFSEHEDSDNPHPNLIQTGSEVTDFTYLNCDLDSGNKKLNRISLDNARTAILGGQANTIPALSGRLSQLERETADMALALTAQEIYPDYNMLLSEDFQDADTIDTFKCQVKSVVAGDNGIDVESLAGIFIGAWYTITDGINQEYIQVKSVIKNGSVFRILAMEDLVNTYIISQTYILRTTAQVDVGFVMGAGDKRGFKWNPSLEWAGVNSNVETSEKLETNQSNASNFNVDGDIDFTADGFVSLINE